MNMTTEQKAARLEMIKAAAKRVEFKKRQAANAATLRRWTDEPERTPRGKKNNDEYTDALLDKLDENHNHWTDGAKYAATHYGAVARNTLREWDE